MRRCMWARHACLSQVYVGQTCLCVAGVSGIDMPVCCSLANAAFKFCRCTVAERGSHTVATE